MQICKDNPIIHLRPLTAWDFMTGIHLLRNLLIGVLGSSLGHALDDLCLISKFDWINLDCHVCSTVFMLFLHVFVVSKKDSESYVCFSDGVLQISSIKDFQTQEIEIDSYLQVMHGKTLEFVT